MKILSGLVSVVFFYIVFTIVVRIRSRRKRKIKEIFHGHVYWETGDNTTNNTSRNNLRSISEVNEDITIPTMIPKPNQLPTLYVLTTGVRKFKNPSYFNVKMVYGETFVDSTGTTFDEGFGPKSKWPIGAKLVADGHVTIWQKIMEECSGWCFVAEDDAQFPSTPPPKMPSDGYVSFYREGVCSKATGPYSKDFKRVIHRIVKGICMPYSTVAYALTKTHAASLLSSLPMDKPVDHFLWEQGILNNRAFVSTVWGVKHVPGPSIKDMNKKPVLGPSKNIKKLPSIAVMLTSYDRKGYLETFSKWLASDPSYISGKFDFFVRDDHSSQYGKTELERWFPKASIAIEAVHHRSDQNIRLNFERFVKMDYDLLLSIDSDSILDPSWYSFITENMPKEGFATLYHSSASWHKTHHCRDGVWCHQSSTGSLGMVLSKELIRKMLLENRNSGFDWGIIEWLKKQKIPVRAPKKSLVLHYGYYGQNNNPRNMHELADKFNMISIHQSVRPCIYWWLKANNPNDFCPHTSYSKKKLVKTSISDYTKTKMDKWFLRMQSIGTPVPKLMDIKGGSIIDVGANVGVFSNNVRKVCKDCHIFAFEAVPDFAKYIESRKIGKIDVYPFGLSDESASADFWLSKDGNYGWNTMIPNKNGRKNMKKVKLKFKAFDELNIDVGNLKLIKIDTEGAEYKVLGGLRNVIQKYKPVVFVEFGFGKSHPNYREEIDEFDKLIEMGYTCDRDYKKVKGTTDLVFKFQNKENSASEVTISGQVSEISVVEDITVHMVWVTPFLRGESKISDAQTQQSFDNWKSVHSNVILWTNKKVRKEFPELVDLLIRIPVSSWSSNILRYAILEKYGGLYVDTDVLAYRSIVPLVNKHPNGFFVCENPRNRLPCWNIATAVLYLPQSSNEYKPLLQKAISESKRILSNINYKTFQYSGKNRVTGPSLPTKMFKQHLFDKIDVLSSQSFFPCDWSDKSKCVYENFKDDESVFGIHLWNKRWEISREFHADTPKLRKKSDRMQTAIAATAIDKVHICLAADKSHDVGISALIRSIKKNTKTPDDVIFHKFSLDSEYSLQDVQPYINSKFTATGRGNLKSPANYVRFILAQKLPQVDACWWIDADVIVQRDIVEYTKNIILNKLVAAFPREPGQQTKINELDDKIYSTMAKEGLHLSSSKMSFNAGIVYLNLKLWRNKNIDTIIRKICAVNSKYSLWTHLGCQPPLQLVSGDDCHYLDRKDYADGLGWRKERTISPKTMFLHWNGPHKPWLPDGWYKEVWEPFSDVKVKPSVLSEVELLPTTYGMWPSETIFISNAALKYKINIFLESGTANGVSTQYISKKHPEIPFLTYDRDDYNLFKTTKHRLQKCCSNVKPYKVNDGIFEIETYLKDHPDVSAAVIIDGPKGQQALKAAKSILKYPNVRFIAIHDTAPSWGTFKKNDWIIPNIDVEHSWSSENRAKYEHLDVDRRKNVFGPGVTLLIPHKKATTPDPRIPTDNSACKVQFWVDVDNVLADSTERYRKYGSDNTEKYAEHDSMIPQSNNVIDNLFWRGCPIHIITARGLWPNGESMTHQWLETHGFLFHSLHLTNHARDKVPILQKHCSASNPCVFIDDLRSGWHKPPYGEQTSVYTDLVNTYNNEPHITLELFNTWNSIRDRYLPQRKSDNSYVRTSHLNSGTRGVLWEHVKNSPLTSLTENNFDILWVIKQNPPFQYKTLYEQLNINIKHKSKLPWATMLQKVPLATHQMVNSIPGIVETFGTKSGMYTNARNAFALSYFRLPDDLNAFKSSENKDSVWIFKPDGQSNGIGMKIGDVNHILETYSGGHHGIVQEFNANPMLTNSGKKMDFRYYLFLKSLDGQPMQYYYYKHGYARVAAKKWSTNLDIGYQILNSKKSQSTRIATQELWEKHMTHVDVTNVEHNIHALLRTVACSIKKQLGCKSAKFPYKCGEKRFQLVGVDLGLDDSGKALLFEFGFDPSLKRRSGPASQSINQNDNKMYGDIFSILTGHSTGGFVEIIDTC